MIKLKSISPNPNNPRTIDKEQLSKLKNSIIEFEKMIGFSPMVVDETDIVSKDIQRLAFVCRAIEW